MGAERREASAFQQIEDRDPPLLLDIGAAPQDRALVEIDRDQARIGHAIVYRAEAALATDTTSRWTVIFSTDLSSALLWAAG